MRPPRGGEEMKTIGTGVLLAVLAALLLCPQAVGGVGTVDYVLLVDNTGSMRYGGRGEATTEAVRCFVGDLRDGDRVSVYYYGEVPAPMLRDWPVTIAGDASRDRVKSQLRFSFTADRTDITAGLELVWQDRDRVFPRRSAVDPDQSVIILMTDGKLIPVYDDYSRYDSIYQRSRARLRELAGLFRDEGVTIDAVAVGREDKVDGELLADVALVTGGSYARVGVVDGLPSVYTELIVERPIPVDETADRLAESRGTSEESPGRQSASGGFSWRDEASADEIPTTGHRSGQATVSCRGSWVNWFPTDNCNRMAAGLAVLVGVVAAGAQRRNKWAKRFTADLFGTGPLRVRGFLKPVDPPGIETARPCIGLENPGLEQVKLGVDTAIPSHAAHVQVVFMGTRDGSPPTVVIEKGNVTIDGQLVHSHKLSDGDVLEIEGLQYRYLRGNRK
jgi:Mg-chelatase subunit ChlD